MTCSGCCPSCRDHHARGHVCAGCGTGRPSPAADGVTKGYVYRGTPEAAERAREALAAIPPDPDTRIPANAPRNAVIRAWARGQGYKVGAKGRISADIIRAYEEAVA